MVFRNHVRQDGLLLFLSPNRVRGRSAHECWLLALPLLPRHGFRPCCPPPSFFTGTALAYQQWCREPVARWPGSPRPWKTEKNERHTLFPCKRFQWLSEFEAHSRSLFCEKPDHVGFSHGPFFERKMQSIPSFRWSLPSRPRWVKFGELVDKTQTRRGLDEAPCISPIPFSKASSEYSSKSFSNFS